MVTKQILFLENGLKRKGCDLICISFGHWNTDMRIEGEAVKLEQDTKTVLRLVKGANKQNTGVWFLHTEYLFLKKSCPYILKKETS